MHFAAWLTVGESVHDPLRYYRQQRRRHADACSRRWPPRGVRGFVFSSTCAVYGEPVETPIAETHPQRPINATARRSWRSSGRCRTAERAYGLQAAVLRYFNAAGADPDGELGEDHEPEMHLIPARDAGGHRRARRCAIFGDDYPTPDGTCLRDYVHVIDLADAHVLALQALEGPGGGDVQPRERPPASSVRDVDRHGRAGDGPAGAGTTGGRGGPAIRRCCSPRARLAAAGLHWQPRHSDLETIVGTAWPWHQRAPARIYGGMT